MASKHGFHLFFGIALAIAQIADNYRRRLIDMILSLMEHHREGIDAAIEAILALEYALRMYIDHMLNQTGARRTDDRTIRTFQIFHSCEWHLDICGNALCGKILVVMLQMCGHAIDRLAREGTFGVHAFE